MSTLPETEVKFYIQNSLDKDWLPQPGTHGAVGYDCKANVLDMPEFGHLDFASHTKKDTIVYNHEHSGKNILIPLGIQAIIPEGYWLEIRPRSSTFAKVGLICLDGVIDEDYTGEIKLACKLFIADGYTIEISHGQKIAQLILHKKHTFTSTDISKADFDKLAEVKIKQRDPAGFGTTGK